MNGTAMLHAFKTDDFLNAVADFDRHARQGARQVAGNSCRKRAAPPQDVASYAALGSASAALEVCRDLWALAAQAGEPSALVAVFEGPRLEGSHHFESLLWRQLQTMHGVDAQCFDEAAAAQADPTRRLFSIGGKAWRVRGMPDDIQPRIVFEPARA